MASAAAVAANQARSPLANDLGDDDGRTGEVTSGVYSKDEDLPDMNEEEDEDDEDLPANPMQNRGGRRRVNGAAQDEEEEEEEEEPPAGDDLFGDEDEAKGEAEQPARRQLDDEELDSGDDMDRTDRVNAEPEQEFGAQELSIMELEMPRQAVPEPSDGEMYLLKMPSFMAIEPQAWDHKAFQPPTTDHHSTKRPSETFSAFNTALSTMRWRHSPSDRSQLQSNARINRWSDGSLTLQLASDPTTQYEVDANALAPPQRNPLKPTPTSMQALGGKAGRHGAALSEKYNQAKDAFTYLLRPNPDSGVMMVTHKITAGLSVKQSATVEDDAIERLQASLAAASNASKVNGASGINLVHIDEDPEKARLQAAKALQESEKSRKKQQAAVDREAARSERVLGRKGLGASRAGGLNVGMLEDDEEGGAGGRGRAGPNKARKPRRRRNSEYSEEEDFGRQRFSREDEYDEEDDFLAPSDEEEVVEDDEDPDDGIVEDAYRRERTPKRDRPVEDDEADAPGEEEDEDQVQASRSKRRRVIADEDEDE
ncbi:Paf1 complex component [Saxophila tyrrhenica]|uniref:Paf1 complex component n=1 Tax=Saxophila tyrrhenica TaxID=1690608 RepID=A0AAV9P9A3_9PEZI|nr:Paf1 complex component [Saxophila tyrrhenica]